MTPHSLHSLRRLTRKHNTGKEIVRSPFNFCAGHQLLGKYEFDRPGCNLCCSVFNSHTYGTCLVGVQLLPELIKERKYPLARCAGQQLSFSSSLMSIFAANDRRGWRCCATQIYTKGMWPIKTTNSIIELKIYLE